MKKLSSLSAIALTLLIAAPVMADRRYDYRNYDRGARYESGRTNFGRNYYRGYNCDRGNSGSSWGLSFGFGYSNAYRSYDDCNYSYRPVYREPVYRETRVYRSYEPCETYYRPTYYDCGESYYPARTYYAPSYSYTSFGYSSGNYCSTSRYYGSYYSNYSAPSSYFSVRFQYGR